MSDSTDKPRAEQPGVGGSGASSQRRIAAGQQPLTPDLELREVQGSKPGSRYFRVTPRSQRAFERVEEGEYRATAVALKPRTRSEGLWRAFKRIVVGAPLATSQLIGQRLDKVRALAVFSSDNLSSSAYATEEILLVLILAGTSAFYLSIPIALAISGLVVIVVTSYSQTVRAYPTGGGAYIVAKDNLGTMPGLVAGASLLVDYVLTVAVSIAAGVAAITSAVPELHDLRVELAVGAVVFMTLANLRGIRENGTIVAIPAYFFILSMSGLIITGLVRLALGHDLQAGTPSHPIEAGTQGIGLFLILRAYASGSAALTGIEAISNGVPAFKPPEARNAAISLFWMAFFLTAFFLGLSVLAHQVDVMPSETKTVVAQVAETVYGRTPLFFAVQAATAVILILAANTSFADFPRLSSVMARDRFLPRQFTLRGDRLAFSHGIVLLGLASIALLIIYGAETHRLIPLYAVGVFVGFTLSQAGMVLHWRHDPSPRARISMLMNGVGAAATGVVAVIIASTKFVDGAWITVGAIAIIVLVITRIHHHYLHVEEQLAVRIPDEPPPARSPVLAQATGPAVVLPVDEINLAVLQTLEYAHLISDNITAVHITDEVQEGERLRNEWARVISDVPLLIIESPYRSFVAPMLAYIDAVDRLSPEEHLTVALPEFVPVHFWQGFLHNQTALPLKRALIRRPHTVIIDVPYQLR